MRSIAVVVIALVGGVIVGRSLATKHHASISQHFGPYTEIEGFSNDQVTDFLSKAIKKGKGKAEVVGELKFGFGVMERGTEGKHVFKIKNVGDGWLRLQDGGSTCKCTVGELGKSGIAPGETSDVTLTWKTQSQSTEFSQTATIRTTDPYNPEIALEIYGTLVETILVEPSAWDIGDVTSGDSIKVNLTAYSFKPEPIKILEAEFLEPEFQERAKVEWNIRKPTVDEDRERVDAEYAIDIDALIQPGVEQGLVNQTLRVRYVLGDGESDDSHFDVNLSGRIVGPLRLVGGGSKMSFAADGSYQFNMGRTGRYEGKEQKLVLMVRGEGSSDLAIKIADVQPEDVFEASLGKESRKGRLRTIPLTIRVRDGAPAGKYVGRELARQSYLLVKPEGEKLSPLKLWLTVEVTAAEN